MSIIMIRVFEGVSGIDKKGSELGSKVSEAGCGGSDLQFQHLKG